MKKKVILFLLTAVLVLSMAATLSACKGDKNDTDDRDSDHSHKYGEWVVELEPTCTEEGRQYAECKSCDKKKNETIAPLGHDIISHDAKAATCTEKGWEAYQSCSRCDHTTIVETTGSHSYVGGVCSKCGSEGDTAWYDTKKSEFTITKAEELRGLAILVNDGNDFKGKTVFLGNDIDLGLNEWQPIGTKSNAFCGTFDGNGHTVSNVKISKANRYVGLFGVNNGTIKNFSINVFSVEQNAANSNAYIGAAAAYCENAKISEVHASGVSVTIKSDDTATIGALIGYVGASSEISKCTAESSTIYATAPTAHLGGLIGELNASSLSESFASASVTTEGAKSTLGGLIGNSDASSITNSHSEGKVVSTTKNQASLGGLIGHFSAGTLSNSYADCEIKLSPTYDSTANLWNSVGGLIGSSADSMVTACFSAGSINSASKMTMIGTLLGTGATTLVSNCRYSVSQKIVSTGSMSGTNNSGTISTVSDLYTNILNWPTLCWTFRSNAFPIISAAK